MARGNLHSRPQEPRKPVEMSRGIEAISIEVVTVLSSAAGCAPIKRRYFASLFGKGGGGGGAKLKAPFSRALPTLLRCPSFHGGLSLLSSVLQILLSVGEILSFTSSLGCEYLVVIMFLF